MERKTKKELCEVERDKKKLCEVEGNIANGNKLYLMLGPGELKTRARTSN